VGGSVVSNSELIAASQMTLSIVFKQSSDFEVLKTFSFIESRFAPSDDCEASESRAATFGIRDSKYVNLVASFQFADSSRLNSSILFAVSLTTDSHSFVESEFVNNTGVFDDSFPVIDRISFPFRLSSSIAQSICSRGTEIFYPISSVIPASSVLDSHQLFSENLIASPSHRDQILPIPSNRIESVATDLRSRKSWISYETAIAPFLPSTILNQGSNSTFLSTAALIGLIVAGLVLIAILSILFLYLCRSKQYEYTETSIEIPAESTLTNETFNESNIAGVEFKNQMDFDGTGDVGSQFESSFGDESEKSQE
jgi:nitrogen fixation-related uncharacterized protein